MILRAAALVLALLAAAPALARAEVALGPFTAEYEVLLKGKAQGRSTLSLEPLGDGRWRYRLSAEGTSGLARLSGFQAEESTEFVVADGRPRIQRSEGRNQALWRDRHIVAEFDWRRGEVVWSGDLDADRRGARPIAEGATNGALLNVLLALDAGRMAPGEAVQYTLWERGRQRPARYVAGPRERIDGAGGTVEAIPLTSSRDNGRRVTTAWYRDDGAPTPVRVLQTRDGKPHFELRLLRVTP